MTPFFTIFIVGLAHTVAGFFAPLATSIELVKANLPAQASGISILHGAAIVAGGTGWFLATYAGPAVSLLRSRFPRRANITLGIAYIVVLLTFSWISAEAARVEASIAGEAPGLAFSVLRELVQPLRW